MFEYKQRFIHKYFDLEAIQYRSMPNGTFNQYDVYSIKDVANNKAADRYITSYTSAERLSMHDRYTDFWQEWQPLPQIIKGHWYKGLSNYPDVVYKVERLIPRLNTYYTDDNDERPHPDNIHFMIWGYAPGIDSNTTRIKEYFYCIRSLSYLEKNSVPATERDITHALTELANNMGFFNTRLIRDAYGGHRLLNQIYGVRRPRAWMRRGTSSTDKGGVDFIDEANQFGYIKYDKAQDELNIVISDFYPGTYKTQTETSIPIYSASTWGIPVELSSAKEEQLRTKEHVEDTISEQELYGVHTHDGYKIKDPDVFLFEPVLSTGALKSRKVKNTRPQDFAYFYSEEEATDYLDRHKAVYSKEEVAALLEHISKEVNVSLNRTRYELHKSTDHGAPEPNPLLTTFIWYMFGLYGLIQDYKQTLKSGSGLSAILNSKSGQTDK